MKRAVLILGGTIDDYAYAASVAKSCDFVICCDGGVYHAQKMHITPNLIIGDFDSSEPDVFPDTDKIVLIKEKDQTDAEVAVLHALENGFLHISILASLGGRLDHELANLSLLKLIGDHGGKGVICSKKNTVYFADPQTPFHMDANAFRRENYTLSILPVSEATAGVTTRGLGYPLKDATLLYGSTRGVSNTLAEDTVTVTVKKGRLFIILSID